MIRNVHMFDDGGPAACRYRALMLIRCRGWRRAGIARVLRDEGRAGSRRALSGNRRRSVKPHDPHHDDAL